MKDQLRPRELRCAFAERTLLDLHPQGYLPACIEVRPLFGFLVRNAIASLQQKGGGPTAGRHTVATIVRAVEHDEIIITKHPPALAGQGTTEGFLTNMIQMQMVRLPQPPLRTSISEHAFPSQPMKSRPDYAIGVGWS